MENNFSKKLFKTEEDTCKKYTAECLKGDQIHAVDIDTLYFFNNVWHVFEFLKCDHPNVTPHTSDPYRYPFNWKKFHTLYQIAKKMEGKLILVNYADKKEYEDMVRVMIVKSLNYKTLNLFSKMTYNELKNTRIPYMEYEYDKKMTKNEFSDWLRNINKNAQIIPLENE